MQILEIVSGTQPNGAVLQCIALIRELVRRGHGLHLVCRPGAWIARQLADLPAVRVIESDLHRWPTDELRRIARLARERHVDLIHTHNSRGHSFGILLGWFSGLPVIASAHCRRFHPRWFFNDFVIAHSQATWEFNRRWNLVRKDRIARVPYLVDMERFASARDLREEFGIGGDERVIGIIGDVSRRKGQLDVVRALPAIRRAVPDLRLLIVGRAFPDYERRVRREAEKLHVHDCIIWAGYRDDMPAVMRTLDVCVSAAREEAFGLTMPEALAAGVPVVATAVGGLPETVIHEETGLLVPPGSPKRLATAIIRTLTARETAAQMAAAGRDRMRHFFNIPRDVARIEQIFESVVANKNPRGSVIEAAQ